MTKRRTDHIVHIVAGPTASGKSAYALELAAQHNGVIINADSMQIYDALHVLTAQPPEEDISQAPHRLYAALPPSQRCTPQIWREMTEAEIRNAHETGQTPIITGGTGLYIKALLEGFSPIPDVPQDVRAAAMAEQQRIGNPAFYEALAVFDPAMAQRLNPNDTQRLVRAWEVFKATGKSLAYWQSLPPSGPPSGLKFHISVILPDRETLYARCNQRFDRMIESGILEEVKALDALIESGTVPKDAPITNALGFKPLQASLRGALPLDEAITQAKTETRQYAKRQVTWFRHQLTADEIITL